MKTDKLFYRIFLNQPGLIAELLPEIPVDCEFEYSAPVIKEIETRLDGLLTPIGDHPHLPLVFLEAQMQIDETFYGRYFRGVFTYLDQYNITRPWQGLLILLNRNLNLGSEIPYQSQFVHQVERFYLEDLLEQENLSPNLAILKLIVTPESQAGTLAKQILNSAETEKERRIKLDLVEAILVNKFTQLTIEEIQKMINLKEADGTQTRYYQEVFQRGKADMAISQLNRRCGNLTKIQEQKVRSLSLPQLESLGYALLDFQNLSDLENWFKDNSINL